MILKFKLSALAIELSALQLCTQASTSLPSYSGRCCYPALTSSPSPAIWASKLICLLIQGSFCLVPPEVACCRHSGTGRDEEKFPSPSLPSFFLTPSSFPHPPLAIVPSPLVNLPISSPQVSAEQTPLLVIRTGSHFSGSSCPNFSSILLFT